MRNVEETQLKPTKKLLESLFEEMEAIQNPGVEENEFGNPTIITENEELTYYRDAYSKNNAKLTQIRSMLGDVIKGMKLVKNAFGANYYSLKLTIEEYKIIKGKLENDTL